MKIKNLTLKNIGRFEDLSIDFAPTQENESNITVIMGNNGAGKTTILNSVASSLDCFITKFQGESKNNESNDSDNANIRNQATFSLKKITVSDNYYFEKETEFFWQTIQKRSGTNSDFEDDYNALNVYVSLCKSLYTGLLTYHMNNESSISYPDKRYLLPVLAFYPVERTVVNTPLDPKNGNMDEPISIYKNAFKQNMNFDSFFEWFRKREDIENEKKIICQNAILHATDNHSFGLAQERLKQSLDPQLSAVRNAVSTFIEGFSNLRVSRSPKLQLLIDKNGEALDVLQLSQGEKSLMTLVGDIARRLAMVTREKANPLEGYGIILIDEIDLHLHPQWQKGIIERLRKTFPNCQFILTTHSPLVINDDKDILLYTLNNGELHKENSQYGEDVNTVLLEVMDTEYRNDEVTESLDTFYDMIQNNSLSLAQKQILHLESILASNNSDLIKAKLLLKKMELRNAQNN